ncbi:MAG: hypothetical protein PHG29_06500 [Prolixibacteraceae bacterium]|nr:hypothetical protein [Bacteroidales bacterium]MDD4755714.1 hypothetical protein [Prolixibacteraceae bacterium]
MKTKVYFFILMIMGSLLSSCEKIDIDFENEYEKSYKNWIDFKETSGNSYKYMVTGSSWTGISWETVITVSNGIITQRDFKYTSIAGLDGNIPEEELEWTEYGSDINSHRYTSAYEALTLDVIYSKARQEWLLKRENVQTYFETKNNGLISCCGYVENGCMDDCFIGINIAYIEQLP